jgi:hypothetical protein
MTRLHRLTLLALFVLLALPLRAQLSWDSKAFMPVSEIKVGMTGYGKTVLHDTTIETFPVKVIGIMKGWDFNDDLILIQVTGGPIVEKGYGSVQGMSGSPIYIKNRLIGAYALGWAGQKDPIAGVTPIAAMLESYRAGAGTPTASTSYRAMQPVQLHGRTYTQATVARTALERGFTPPGTLALAPLATPLFVSGLGGAALDTLQKAVAPLNLTVVPAPAGPPPAAAKPVKLEPGTMVGAGLFMGHIDGFAMGTVTYVKGNTVLAFGHPFTDLGDVDLPMVTAHVQTVVRTIGGSFKLATRLQKVGTLVRDATHAVAGTIGRAPRLVPADITVRNAETGFTRKLHIEFASSRFFTARYLFGLAVYRALLTVGAPQSGGIGGDFAGMYSARFAFTTVKYGTVEQRMSASARTGGFMMPLSEGFQLVDALYSNPFDPVGLQRFVADIDYYPHADTARIIDLTPDRYAVRPGETVTLTVKLQPYGKAVETRTVTARIPEYLTAPQVALMVVGGTESGLLRSIMTPQPTNREGLRGFLRASTGNLSGPGLVTATFVPSPAYNFHGHLLRDVPGPAARLLPWTEWGEQSSPGGSRVELLGRGWPMMIGYPHIHPTTYTTAQDDPYLIAGGQLVTLAVDTAGEAAVMNPGSFILPAPNTELLPALSPGQARMTATELIPGAAQRLAEFRAMLPAEAAAPTPPAAPRLDAGPVALPPPLSGVLALDAAPNVPPSPVLNAKPNTVALGDAKEFVAGRHFGSVATTTGKLTVAPQARALYQTPHVPWVVAVLGDAVYSGGWGSPYITRIEKTGAVQQIPVPRARGTEILAVTALAAAGGDLLVATWPDNRVRLLHPNGVTARAWTLPADTVVWDLAVTADGRRYAACSGGALLQLRDEEKETLRPVVTVPDRHVYTLAVAGDTLYLGTAPRGKVYRLAKNGTLAGIYEATTGNTLSPVYSLAADAAGYVYAGVTPSCSVVRIAPNGQTATVLTGLGKDNAYVMALELVGDTLYAATAPTGGIYRVARPASTEPEITAIFAREDTVASDAQPLTTGPESLAVTALTAGADGTVYAAAAFPGQVLALTPRPSATFLSPVVKAAPGAVWGKAELRAKDGDTTGIVLESRTGLTTQPDATWQAWKPVDLNGRVTSDPATYLQFRIRLQGTPTVDGVRVAFQPANTAPTVKFTEPKAWASVSGKKDVRWDSADLDGDTLVDYLYLSPDKGRTWEQMTVPGEAPKPAPAEKKEPEKKDAPVTGMPATPEAKPVDTPAPAPEKPKQVPEMKNKSFTLDTKGRADGVYQLKVVTSDRCAKPGDPKSAQAIITVTIDNTAPAVNLDDKVTGLERVARFEISDALSALVSASYTFDDAPAVALLPEDGVFDTTRERVILLLPEGVRPAVGEHTLTIHAKDAADNVLTKTITLTIPEPSVARVGYQ